jgi:phenylpropionate dioxygenase-like ring-hydroxylating dioxygenase large terminal subunit
MVNEMPFARLVAENRVHRSVYVSPEVLDAERERIFGGTWLYVGHESQVRAAGDYFCTLVAGRPVFMIRDASGDIQVLHNHCPHRGALLAGGRTGNARILRCCYHGWAFRTNGRLQAIPCMESYAESEVRIGDPRFDLEPLHSAVYRGFVFATLKDGAPPLAEWLGRASSVLDNMTDRAPDAELEVAGGCFRAIQRNNWKIYLENLHDGMHPKFVHQSSLRASDRVYRHGKPDAGSDAALRMHIIAANDQDFEKMSALTVDCFGAGHSMMHGFRNPRGDDPVAREYEDALAARRGVKEADRILSLNYHNANIYPNLSVHPSFMQLRVIFPLSVDRTLVEIWTLRLKGAPEAFNRRNILYANTVHSPSSIIKVDDLEAYRRVQAGNAGGNEWVSQHARHGAATGDDTTGSALGEHYIRHQYRAWRRYMVGSTA